MDARSTSNTQTHSAAYFLLEGLNEIGIDYLFCNFGTDHAPIIEELANRKQRGEPVPKTIRCAHENTAAHMAAGYALMTGRGQGVLVHVDVGTANTATAMHNLFRSRLPVLLMAGKAPYTTAHELTGTRDTYVHFVQEPFDQGSLVRPYVKWEWTLPSGVVVKEALRRAHTIMQSEPRGPVYLMMARETLAQDWDEADIRRYPAEQFGGAAQGAADPELIGVLAARRRRTRC
jgi:acetolactate synthase-1/2/3 large subunit